LLVVEGADATDGQLVQGGHLRETTTGFLARKRGRWKRGVITVSHWSRCYVSRLYHHLQYPRTRPAYRYVEHKT
jgi:hypothetical protein